MLRGLSAERPACQLGWPPRLKTLACSPPNPFFSGRVLAPCLPPYYYMQTWLDPAPAGWYLALG